MNFKRLLVPVFHFFWLQLIPFNAQDFILLDYFLFKINQLMLQDPLPFLELLFILFRVLLDNI